jgi:hypothetical protein
MVSGWTSDGWGRIVNLEQLEDVVSNINIGEFGVQASEVGVVDVFEDEGGGFALRGECQQRAGPRREKLTWLSRTTSSRPTMLGPPLRFWRILISRLIFFFLTGLRTLMTHFW